MEKIKEYFDFYFNVICTVLLVFIITGIVYVIYLNFDDKNDNNTSSIVTSDEKVKDNISINLNENIIVDIKGAVKKPGVYKMNLNDNISDLIENAGGLTKNGTTTNVNLAKKLENEMVINIFTKNDLKKKKITQVVPECKSETIYINECISNGKSIISTGSSTIYKDNEISNNNGEQNNKEDNNLRISINNASKDELMTLSGVGESKAKAIIEYRENNGLFKEIEDIKNVSGIGDALFESIKENITI